MQVLLVQQSEDAVRERISFSIEGRFHARVREALLVSEAFKVLNNAASSVDLIVYDDSTPSTAGE